MGRSICERCWDTIKLDDASSTSLGVVLRDVVDHLGPIIVPASLVLLLVNAPTFAVDWLIVDPPFYASIVGLLAILGTTFVMHLTLQRLSDGRHDLSTAMRDAVQWFFPLVGLGILIALQIFVFTLLCIVPGILRSIDLYIANAGWIAQRMAGRPITVTQALQRSIDAMRGRRLDIVVLVILLWIPVIVPSIGLGMLHALIWDGTIDEIFRLPAVFGTMFFVAVLSVPISMAQAIVLVRVMPPPFPEG